MAVLGACALRALRASKLSTAASRLRTTTRQSLFPASNRDLSRGTVPPEFRPEDLSSAASFDDRLSPEQVRKLMLEIRTAS